MDVIFTIGYSHRPWLRPKETHRILQETPSINTVEDWYFYQFNVEIRYTK